MATLKEIAKSLSELNPGGTLSLDGVGEINSSYFESPSDLGGFSWDQIKGEMQRQTDIYEPQRFAERMLYSGMPGVTEDSPYFAWAGVDKENSQGDVYNKYWKPIAEKYGINKFPTLGETARGAPGADAFWDSEAGTNSAKAWHEYLGALPRTDANEGQNEALLAGLAMVLTAGAAGGAFGALGGGAGAGAGVGVGELGTVGTGLAETGGSLYGLGSAPGGLGFNAGGFLGGAGATPGLGFVAPSAASWGGFGAEALGSLGALGADYGLGSGAGNLGFDASGAFGGTSNLGGTAGSGLGINTPASSGWWGAGSGVAQAAPSSTLFEQIKSAYDTYYKPASQANSALKMLGGGGSTGTGGPMLRTQEQPTPAPAGGSTMQGGGMGAGPPGSGYAGFPGFGMPEYGGLPQTPQYQPQGQQPQQDPNWFIPEYLRRGVIGR